MKLIVAVMACLFMGWACAADPLQVDVRRENGKILLSAAFSAPVSREIAWAVITDFEHMPQFVPNLKSSRILSREGNVLRVAQQGVIPLLMLDYAYESLREIELYPQQALNSHSVGGNTGAMAARTVLDVQDLQTRIQYSAVWTPASSLIGALGLDIMREQVGLQFRAIQQEMLKRSKTRPASPTVSQMIP
jgi:hypothetical protein